ANDGLSGIRIGMNLESWVFLRQLVQRDAHLLLITFGLGLDRNRDYRLGKFDRLQSDGMFFGADRVAGCDVLQSYAGANVARVDLVDLFTLIGVHLEQASDTLGAASGGV